jgi:hypothetical protein
VPGVRGCRHRSGRIVFRFRALADFQKHQRNAIIAQIVHDITYMHQLHPAVLELVEVFRIFKAQRAQTVLAIINAAASK